MQQAAQRRDDYAQGRDDEARSDARATAPRLSPIPLRLFVAPGDGAPDIPMSLIDATLGAAGEGFELADAAEGTALLAGWEVVVVVGTGVLVGIGINTLLNADDDPDAGVIGPNQNVGPRDMFPGKSSAGWKWQQDGTPAAEAPWEPRHIGVDPADGQWSANPDDATDLLSQIMSSMFTPNASMSTQSGFSLPRDGNPPDGDKNNNGQGDSCEDTPLDDDPLSGVIVHIPGQGNGPIDPTPAPPPSTPFKARVVVFDFMAQSVVSDRVMWLIRQ